MKGVLGNVAELHSHKPSSASITNAVDEGENRAGDYLAVSATGKVYGTLKVEPITTFHGCTN